MAEGSGHSDGWRIAVLDSGVVPALAHLVRASRGFSTDGYAVRESDVVPDVLGHGSTVAQIITGAGGSVGLYIGQVFVHSHRTTPACLARAMLWAIGEGVHLIHLSLGLRRDRGLLRDACARAVHAGVVVVGASPARGARVFPAGYQDVIRATGDARCRPGEISHLDSSQADFGACPMASADSPASIGGASVGAAYVSRCIVDSCRPRDDLQSIREKLRSLAIYSGPERRRAPAEP